MKKFIYILLIILLYSCSSEHKERRYEKSVPDDSVLLESKSSIRAGRSISSKSTILNELKYELIAKQKLQDYIELLQLKKDYPELRKDIEEQLKSLSNEATENLNIDASIENIHQVGGIETVSDSVKKIKLKYLLLSGNKRVEYFVYAYVKFSTLIVDGREIRANKISFSKK